MKPWARQASRRISMESVYLETTFISYLVARPSRDLLVAGHQQVSQEWWADRRASFECFVSEVVHDEASVGDPAEIQKRSAILDALAILEVTDGAKRLTKAILAAGALPSRAARDAAHIAVATVHEMDYLLTWNCKHLANAQIVRRVELICQKQGFQMPVICTPEELMGE